MQQFPNIPCIKIDKVKRIMKSSTFEGLLAVKETSKFDNKIFVWKTEIFRSCFYTGERIRIEYEEAASLVKATQRLVQAPFYLKTLRQPERYELKTRNWDLTIELHHVSLVSCKICVLFMGLEAIVFDLQPRVQVRTVKWNVFHGYRYRFLEILSLLDMTGSWQRTKASTYYRWLSKQIKQISVRLKTFFPRLGLNSKATGNKTLKQTLKLFEKGLLPPSMCLAAGFHCRLEPLRNKCIQSCYPRRPAW